MSIRAFAAAAALALAASAEAQTPPTGAQTPPTGVQPRLRPDDPAVKTPPLAPPSAFAGYRPFLDEPPAPWREVNDEVGRLGGHMGHMKGEAAESAAPQLVPGSAAPESTRPNDAPGGRTHEH